MKNIIAATLAFIALQALPLSAWAQEAVGTFYHNVAFRNFSESNKQKVLVALEHLVAVVESDEFREVVLNFKDNKGRTGFLENNGLTNAQIYQVIMDGAEKLRPVADNTLDLDITWYYSWKNTVGYTYADSPRIWVNSKFYSKYNAAQMSRNLFHEWTHKLGFGHVSGTKNRPWTIPYGLGSKMEELVGKRIKQGL